MEIKQGLVKAALTLLMAASASNLAAQTHEEAVPARPAAPIQGAGQFPSLPPGDPASVARGQASYKTNCAYCHGEDARGGENGGTNLLRSDTLIKDKNGELLREFLLNANGADHVAAR